MRPLLAALVLSLAPAWALSAPITVPMNQVKRLSFAGLAASVSPGNPAIADVNVVDERTILVVGKKPGITNLIVLDRAGRTLFSDRIIVSDGDQSNTVTVSRGGAVSNYACSPYCQTLSGPPPTSSASSTASYTVTAAPAGPAAP